MGSSFDLSYFLTPAARREPSMRTKGHGTEQISMYTCGPTVDHSRFIFSHKKRSNRLAQGQTSHPHSPANQEQRQEEELQHCEVGRMEVEDVVNKERGWRKRGRKAQMSQPASLRPRSTLAAPEFCVSSQLPARD